MLKFALGQPLQLTFNDLKDLADIVGVDTSGNRSSKADVLRCIAMHISADDGVDNAVAFAAKAVELAEEKAPADFFVDPLTEAAFDELDPEERKEFSDVKQKIAKGRQSGRSTQARKRAAAEMEGGDRGHGGRGRGRGLGRLRFGLRGRGRGRAAVVVAEPVAPPPAQEQAPRVGNLQVNTHTGFSLHQAWLVHTAPGLVSENLLWLANCRNRSRFSQRDSYARCLRISPVLESRISN
jgi:hypothetical protein